ncbi:MAG: divalent-cation tolerance protein CutA [Alphaproteobacteria bacterium]|nr:divalent-cation tolerance protein CutA [Alphaproteobacteria bacterium]
MSDEIVLVYVTCPDADVAASLARTLVQERRAACGNIIPGLRSIYAWQGEIHDDPEVLLLLKTRRSEVGNLADRVVALHPYDVPEVVAVPVVAGHGAYLDWVRAHVDVRSPS